MNIQDYFNQNNGAVNAIGHLAAVEQRDLQIAQQKEHAEAIRKQTAELEKANQIEADRAKIEKQRLEIEHLRLESEKAERNMKLHRDEQIRQLRNLMADSFDQLAHLRAAHPAN